MGWEAEVQYSVSDSVISPFLFLLSVSLYPLLCSALCFFTLLCFFLESKSKIPAHPRSFLVSSLFSSSAFILLSFFLLYLPSRLQSSLIFVPILSSFSPSFLTFHSSYWIASWSIFRDSQSQSLSHWQTDRCVIVTVEVRSGWLTVWEIDTRTDGGTEVW